MTLSATSNNYSPLLSGMLVDASYFRRSSADDLVEIKVINKNRNNSSFNFNFGITLGKISTQPHTLIIHAFCDSNSIRFWNRVSMTVIHV